MFKRDQNLDRLEKVAGNPQQGVSEEGSGNSRSGAPAATTTANSEPNTPTEALRRALLTRLDSAETELAVQIKGVGKIKRRTIESIKTTKNDLEAEQTEAANRSWLDRQLHIEGVTEDDLKLKIESDGKTLSGLKEKHSELRELRKEIRELRHGLESKELNPNVLQPQQIGVVDIALKLTDSQQQGAFSLLAGDLKENLKQHEHSANQLAAKYQDTANKAETYATLVRNSAIGLAAAPVAGGVAALMLAGGAATTTATAIAAGASVLSGTVAGVGTGQLFNALGGGTGKESIGHDMLIAAAGSAGGFWASKYASATMAARPELALPTGMTREALKRAITFGGSTGIRGMAPLTAVNAVEEAMADTGEHGLDKALSVTKHAAAGLVGAYVGGALSIGGGNAFGQLSSNAARRISQAALEGVGNAGAGYAASLLDKEDPGITALNVALGGITAGITAGAGAHPVPHVADREQIYIAPRSGAPAAETSVSVDTVTHPRVTQLPGTDDSVLTPHPEEMWRTDKTPEQIERTRQARIADLEERIKVAQQEVKAIGEYPDAETRRFITLVQSRIADGLRAALPEIKAANPDIPELIERYEQSIAAREAAVRQSLEAITTAGTEELTQSKPPVQVAAESEQSTKAAPEKRTRRGEQVTDRQMGQMKLLGDQAEDFLDLHTSLGATTFLTEGGNAYVVRANGTTQRFKVPDLDNWPAGETFGLQPESTATFYIHPDTGAYLVEHAAITDRKTALMIHEEEIFPLVQDPSTGLWTAVDAPKEIPRRYIKQPERGVIPLEVFGAEKQGGGGIFERWHSDSKIVELAKPPAELVKEAESIPGMTVKRSPDDPGKIIFEWELTQPINPFQFETIPYGVQVFEAGKPGFSRPMDVVEAFPRLRSARGVALGDLHASYEKLVETLAMSGMIEMPPESAARFAELSYDLEVLVQADPYFDKYPQSLGNARILTDQLKEVITTIRWSGGDRQLRLIGDVVGDRGLSDELVFAVLHQVRGEEPKRIQVHTSNHDLAKLRSLFDPQAGVSRGQSGSSERALKVIVASAGDDEQLNAQRLQEFQQQYFELAQSSLLFDFDPTTETFFAHAPVSSKEIREMLSFLQSSGRLPNELAYGNMTAADVVRFVEASNDAYLDHVRRVISGEPIDPFEVKLFDSLVWVRNRLEAEADLPFFGQGVRMFAHGHDPSTNVSPYSMSERAHMLAIHGGREFEDRGYTIAGLDQRVRMTPEINLESNSIILIQP